MHLFKLLLFGLYQIRSNNPLEYPCHLQQTYTIFTRIHYSTAMNTFKNEEVVKHFKMAQFNGK